jgi:phospholipase/carboxylesterase
MSLASHRYLFEPGPDPASPPLLLLHGTGGDEHDLIPLARQLSPGSALLSPRGNVLERGAPRFFARLAEGVFDAAEITRRTHELADFIAAATKNHGLDPARLTALGFSNGANIAASLLLLRPGSLAAAALLRPMVVIEPTALPRLDGRRVLISSGRHDPIVPPDHPQRLADTFRKAGAGVDLQMHAASHQLVPADLAAVIRWLRPHPGD